MQAARLASRMFLLRSPWAPGLRFIGAETRPQAPDGDETEQVSFSLSGSGEGLEEAFVSCVGEGIDRLSQIERPVTLQPCCLARGSYSGIARCCRGG